MAKSAKVRKQEQRERDKIRKEAELADFIKNGSRERFWAENIERDREKLDLPGLQAQTEVALDQVHWLDYGWRVPPDDVDFVGFKEGVEELHRFLASVGGVIKEERFAGFALQDVNPKWRVWRDFWRDQILVAELQKENLPTALYATYGITTSLFKTKVRKFESDIRSHPGTHRWVAPDANVDCWQCKFEKAQREHEQQTVQAQEAANGDGQSND